jgi:hypothetical protein
VAISTYNGIARNRIARLNADGSLLVSTGGEGANGTINSISIQTDGKLLLQVILPPITAFLEIESPA